MPQEDCSLSDKSHPSAHTEACNPFKTEFLINNIKNCDRTSQETYVSAANINWLMLFWETITEYSENGMKNRHIHSVGRMQSLGYVKQVGFKGLNTQNCVLDCGFSGR